MIRVLFGEKGTGKTKRIIGMANDAIPVTNGSIVFVANDGQYKYEIKRDIRFVDTARIKIDGPKMFHGFLCGISAQDHDLEHIFIDGFMKIVRHDLEALEELFGHLETFAEENNLTITLSISGDPKRIPEYLAPFVL